MRGLLIGVLCALPLAALDATLTLDLRGVKGPSALLHVPGRLANAFTLPVRQPPPKSPLQQNWGSRALPGLHRRRRARLTG